MGAESEGPMAGEGVATANVAARPPPPQPARTPALPSAIPSTKHKAEVSDTDLDPDISDRTAGVPPAVAGGAPPPPPRPAGVVCPLFFVGRRRPRPGAWGSAATVGCWRRVYGRV